MNIEQSEREQASPSDRRIAQCLFLVTFLTCAYFFSGGGWNQNSQFDLTRAIVEQHTFAIDRYAENTGDTSSAHGHVYSNKSPALSWIAAVPYAALNAFERSRGADPTDVNLLTINAWLCSLVCVALPAGLIPPMLFGFARKRGFRELPAVIVSLSSVLSTQLLPYATLFMLHVPSGALLLYALTTRHRGRAGFAAALATATNYLCAPALVAFAFIEWRAIIRYCAGAVAPLVALAAYQYTCFGSIFTISIIHEDPRFLSRGAALGVFVRPTLAALYGITVSPFRGFFFFAPILLVALFGVRAWWLADRRTSALSLFVIAGFFVFNLFFNGWDAGWGIGGRYLVPVIPLLAIALLYVRWQPIIVAIAALSFVMNFAATAVDPQPSTAIARPMTQYILPLLVRGHFDASSPSIPTWFAATFIGHTSVNRMTFDEGMVFQRHPPGSPASEWASFNLGELFAGAGNVLSLLPILCVIAGGAFEIVRLAVKS